MENFLKKVCDGRMDEESHRYFIRFGKGVYRRRFLLSYNKGKNIKVKASFELANDFINFVNELADVRFNGKIMSKENLPGMKGKKKGSSYLYEVTEVKLNNYPNAYSYLLDAETNGIKLKIKKALPKPGKNEEKIDDGFCVMELDQKYWGKVKETFFWDVHEGKKGIIEHDLIIDGIEIPKDEKDPVKMREKAIRIGKITRNIEVDGNKSEKEYNLRG